ncbi:transcriptional regulator [Leptolinea tardivitalis]|uniref:Segregation and condensation protein B n=2 Tax=Leptolinea tardivitalis TaxID=229920 RepID=A0A0N8GLJ9_9CHLR|nr:transcriptional regulator [Leptolinea tardivitalis]
MTLTLIIGRKYPKYRGNYSMSEEREKLPEINLQSALEALLFIAPGPVTPDQLAEVMNVPVNQVEAELSTMSEVFEQSRGLRLQFHGGRVQLTTAPELAPFAEKFLGLDVTARLSRAALEALSIIAYRQPVTRPEVDSIRGVNSDGVLKSLLNKGLVQEVGRAEAPGRPILYGTTAEFLQHFGIDSLQKLPPLEQPESAEAEKGIELLKE